jgi:hypothetical protein
VLPTVEQIHVAWTSFPRWRVDACAQQQHSPALCGDDFRVQAAAEVESTRSMYFLPLRARKAVVAGQVRDGP